MQVAIQPILECIIINFMKLNANKIFDFTFIIFTIMQPNFYLNVQKKYIHVHKGDVLKQRII